MTSTIKRNAFAHRYISAWGTAYRVGDKITLTESYKNFSLIGFYSGYSNTSERVITNLVYPGIHAVGETFTVDVSNTNNPGTYFEIKINSETELEIVSRNNGTTLSNSIRQVFGIQ